MKFMKIDSAFKSPAKYFIWMVVGSLMVSSGLADSKYGPKGPQDWSSLTRGLQKYLDNSRPRFEDIMESIEPQAPYQLEYSPPGGLWVQWTKDAEPMKAPDTLVEQIESHFKALNLMDVRYVPGYVQFWPRFPAHGYKNVGIFYIFVYATIDVGSAPKCSEAMLLDPEREFGRCLLQLEPKNWYVDFSWGRSGG